MSHVIGEWVMSRVNESRHRWMSHVICEVLRHSAARFQLYHVIGDFNYMSHVTVNESGRTYGWVMTLMWMSHITLMSTPAADSAVVRCEKSTVRHVTVNESCHVWMRHVTLMSTPGAAAAYYAEIANVWVMSRVNTSEWVLREWVMSYDSFTRDTQSRKTYVNDSFT